MTRKKARDTIYLPDQGCFVPVEQHRHGTVHFGHARFRQLDGPGVYLRHTRRVRDLVATRDDQGDVCIARQDLWRERMFANLGNPMDRRQ